MPRTMIFAKKPDGNFECIRDIPKLTNPDEWPLGTYIFEDDGPTSGWFMRTWASNRGVNGSYQTLEDYEVPGQVKAMLCLLK
jgi:hypothetical protein